MFLHDLKILLKRWVKDLDNAIQICCMLGKVTYPSQSLGTFKLHISLASKVSTEILELNIIKELYSAGRIYGYEGLMITFSLLLADLQWKSGHMAESLTNMPRHSLYIIIGALCVAFVLMLIILIVGICRISRIEYQGSSRPAYEEFYNCRSIDSEFSSAIASIRHARFVLGMVI